MVLTDKQSNTINLLKGILPIMVVALHTSSSAEPLEYFGSVESFLRVLLYKLGEAAVPAFFFISGYLFFNGFEKWNWKKWGIKLKKRVVTLLVPYLLWMIVVFFGLYLRSYALSEIPSLNFETLRDSFESSGGLRMFYDRPVQNKPIDLPLWYVRDLMILFVLAPVIWRFLKSTKRIGIGFLALAYILDIGIPISGFSMTGFFFLSCGAWFAIKGQDYTDYFGKIRKYIYPTSAILLTACFAVHNSVGLLESILVKLFIISFVATLFCLAYALISAGHGHIRLLTDSSFFTYAIHNILITDVANFLLWRLFPITTEWMSVIKVFLRPALSVVICLLLFVVLRKVCPKALALLTGGRY